MSFQNLKNVYQSLVESILGKRCHSGLGHRIPGSGWISGNKYCTHRDCLEAARNLIATQRIAEIQNQLETLHNTVKDLQHYNNKAFTDGWIQGINMERSKIYNTIAASKQLLLDTLFPIGITEHRALQFVEWYEKTRDPAVNPRQDIVTYNICKNIIALTDIMQELVQEDVPPG